jgi:uncharacterized membrane protein
MMTASHLHVMVIHFPIALLIVAFLSELFGVLSKKQFFTNASFYLLILGSLGALVAYVSGSYTGDGITNGMFQELIEMHEEAGLITLCLAIFTTLYKIVLYYFKIKKVWTQLVSLVLLGILVLAVARTAYLGGQLVFKNGVGIELALPDFGNLPTN